MREVFLENKKYLVLTWEDVKESSRKLCLEIEESFQPTLIIGILRGGAVLANLISDLLNVPNVYVVGARYYKGVDQRGTFEIYQPLPSSLDLRDHSVLLVDEVSDTGYTFINVINSQIKPRNPRDLCTASLYVKPWTNYVPNFYVGYTDAWIIFPWDFYETMYHLKKELEGKYSQKEVDEILSKNFRYTCRSKKIARTNKNVENKI